MGSMRSEMPGPPAPADERAAAPRARHGPAGPRGGVHPVLPGGLPAWRPLSSPFLEKGPSDILWKRYYRGQTLPGPASWSQEQYTSLVAGEEAQDQGPRVLSQRVCGPPALWANWTPCYFNAIQIFQSDTQRPEVSNVPEVVQAALFKRGLLYHFFDLKVISNLS